MGSGRRAEAASAKHFTCNKLCALVCVYARAKLSQALVEALTGSQCHAHPLHVEAKLRWAGTGSEAFRVSFPRPGPGLRVQGLAATVALTPAMAMQAQTPSPYFGISRPFPPLLSLPAASHFCAAASRMSQRLPSTPSPCSCRTPSGIGNARPASAGHVPSALHSPA